MKILIAEDDIHIRNGLSDMLSSEGYTIITAENGKVALAKYQQEQPDFLILDIMMPELDGYSVCKEIRKSDEHTPIVFLSAKGDEIDKVLGLELGADDYINKPFGIHEVRARIKTIARRCLKTKHNSPDQPFQFGDLLVYPAELCAKRGQQVIELSLREIKILMCLWQHKNRVVTRDMLFDYAWGYDHLPNSRTLDQYISKLRKLIEPDPVTPILIKTIHSAGYRYQE
ncbi:response regulator transcription factor [Morganella psychrotolerans]|uniref:DNA-binding response regulator n=1 Tax=Morganella psychrotolerans TaxID=368603 RepID=A0A1B8GZG4_9GAMM|nr:response regulator transcription factor [Morganella psychrotolerans]OBU02211.1 DNA-binding response regulator [Morganella psychrotolerans]